MTIKYVGPFLSISALSYSFTRHLPVSVSVEDGKSLLGAKSFEGKILFEDVTVRLKSEVPPVLSVASK